MGLRSSSTMLRCLCLLLAIVASAAFTPATLAAARAPIASRSAAIEMSRICDISGKRANNAYWQYPNLQTKRFFSEELNRTVKLKVACSTIRTIRKLGVDATAKKYNVDLSKF